MFKIEWRFAELRHLRQKSTLKSLTAEKFKRELEREQFINTIGLFFFKCWAQEKNDLMLK